MFTITNLEENIAYSCAPCFSGLKPANLFSIPADSFKNINFLYESFLNEKGFYLEILCQCKKRVQIFLYNEKALRNLLLQHDVKDALKFFGYSENSSFIEKLNILSTKMSGAVSNHGCDGQTSFPHEIGIFLGYPVYDVLEYYKKRGEGFIFSGYWKVYSNAEKAEKIFNQYNECKKHFALQIEQGLRLYDLLSA